jgi:hypothetical protein
VKPPDIFISDERRNAKWDELRLPDMSRIYLGVNTRRKKNDRRTVDKDF